MELEKLLAITGVGGIYRMVTSRKNGIVVEDLDTEKRKFIPARKHQFTPLNSITIYTDNNDSTSLESVFNTMLSGLGERPLPETGDRKELIGYFEKILPNYDREKVYISDVKKVVKWFKFLNDRELLNASEEEE